MLRKTLVIAPHPDDEILGCGGMLLRRKAEGAKLAWLIVTNISVEAGWPEDRVLQREQEIAQVTKLVGFSEVYNLRLAPTQLERVPLGSLINQFSTVFNAFEPEEVFLPHYADAHTDHHVVFEAAAACTKWFRYPFVQRVLAYETLSETGFGLKTGDEFQPNTFIDITNFLERKLEIMAVYQSELGEFPFPRSCEAIRALASLRGASAGFTAAEAFQLLRQRG